MSAPSGLPPKIVMVGFMAAGKSTVGRRVAVETGYAFVDLDELVERLAGRPVPEIFRAGGEEAFRELEARATGRLDERREVVVAAGGGWMARPDLRSRWREAVRVWLKVGPEAAVARLGDRLESRPMLGEEDPVAAARELLERRRADYERAEVAVETEGRSPEEVAREALRRLGAGTR